MSKELIEKFSFIYSKFFEGLNIKPEFVLTEDNEKTIIFVNEENEKSVLTIYLKDEDRLRGSRVDIIGIETKPLDNEWEAHLKTSTASFENADLETILKSIQEHGATVNTIISAPHDKVVSDQKLLEIYEHVKKVLPDNEVSLTKINDGEVAVSVYLPDGVTYIRNIDGGSSIGSLVAEKEFYNGDSDQYYKIELYLKELNNPDLSKSINALENSIEDFIPEETSVWKHTATFGTDIEIYAMGIADNNEVSIIRGWKTEDGTPNVSLDVSLSLKDFTGEITDDIFRHRRLPDSMIKALSNALPKQTYEILWATDYVGKGAFVIRTAAVNREERVVAGTIEVNGPKSSVEIQFEKPTADFKNENSSSLKM